MRVFSLEMCYFREKFEMFEKDKRFENEVCFSAIYHSCHFKNPLNLFVNELNSNVVHSNTLSYSSSSLTLSLFSKNRSLEEYHDFHLSFLEGREEKKCSRRKEKIIMKILDCIESITLQTHKLTPHFLP